uniref:Guanylate cyclase n=1 Tax=Biomphalaria glabrata TaxID=6526 RepID=A0A2C9JTI9_BIOGL
FVACLLHSDNATAKPWYRPNDTEENNRKARKAYESLMTVTLRKPTSENYKNFSEEVKRRAAKMYPNFTYGEQEVNSFVGAFHDAVILYALALNETIEAGGNVSDGLNITRRMWNRTFEGITGNVSIDENGDRNADYSLLDLNPETGTFEVVAEYFGNTKQYTPTEGKKIHWAGGRDGPPPDEPICGFDGSKCPPKKPFPEYGIVIIVLGSILLVVLIVTFFVYRHFKLEAELAEMNWRVRWEDILFGAPTMNYKKQENRQNQNGHDVLENEEIKLDWMFRYSIMQDIVRGMAYLHSTEIKSHGHLKSSNCVVDSRFVVKITDFGLHYFREKEEELEENLYAKHRSQLWTAPELLRMSNPPAGGTQKADVYSFAIICQEIVYRSGVFHLRNIDLSPNEILDKLKTGVKPYFRPTLEEFDCPNDELAVTIRVCWSEDPAERPDFQQLRTSIKKLNKDGDKGDILDNLLSRMEQYANNLEALVEERTSDYLQEKKKAEELLYNMLPKFVASQLIRGETVSAEWYDGVTIYFSDICGFTAMSAESSPMQVVDLLNDLYTCFDSILESFDVYKVETIGDAYMVVSGLPVRNGNLHAREIARMSLALLHAVFKFKIRHRPGDQLKLRIGMHSGPVCAGVVGLKMPRYCLFGDTVNTSSRMESNGLPLRIHVSPATKEILETFGTFQLEMRGAVEMKGKGAITTYWLLGEKDSPYNIRQQGCNEPGLIESPSKTLSASPSGH